jgi:nicotinamidase/pyrazinamidase
MTHAIGFWDVDTQADFMLPGGALYVRDAEKLIPNLRKLTAFAKKRSIPVVATGDAHATDDPEFKKFPPHCVKGSAGAKKIPQTTFREQTFLAKQTFDIFDRPEADAHLATCGVRDWVVYGVATDYCVRAAVLGLAKRGCRVTVVSDAIQGIDPDTTARAVREMKAAGAHFRATDAVLARLDKVLKPMEKLVR